MISVLTVNYFSRDDLLGLIDSLVAQPPGEPFELLVAQHSPGERITIPAPAANWITVFEQPNRGFAAGINAAAARARGDLLLIANPDMRVTPGAPAAARRRLTDDPTIGVLLPRLRYPDGRVQPSVRRFYTWPVALFARSPLRMLGWRPRFFRDYHYEGVAFDGPAEVDWGLGAAMFVRRADEPLFDERFFLYFEDVDFCYRTWRAGRRVVYDPGVECVHAHRRASARLLSRHAWHHARSFVRFIAKHRGLPGRPERDQE